MTSKVLTPEQMLKFSADLVNKLKLAESKEIAVGLPKNSSLTKKIYQKGKSKSSVSVLDVGIIHEYGKGRNPVRSFLRVPFKINEARIVKALDISYQRIFNGENVTVQMNRVAAFIRDISLGAFDTKGYGTWQDITQATKDRKGSSQILKDNGILRSSIAWVVRNAGS